MSGASARRSVEMQTEISALARDHLDRVRAFYDAAPTTPQAGARAYRRLLAHYYNLLIPAGASVLEIGCGSGELLAQLKAEKKVGVDLSETQLAVARQRMPEGEFIASAGELLALDGRSFDIIIISDTLNLAADVQQLFEQLRQLSHDDTRLLVNFQNSLWRPF